MTLTQTQQDVLSLLKKANHVLLLPSAPIDGDSLGSSLSLYLALKKLGKKVTVVAEDPIPTSYNFLPEISSISRELKFIRDFIVTIECEDAASCGVRHEIQGNKINIIVTPQKNAIAKDHVSFASGPMQYDCIVTVDAADPSQFGKIYENFTELFHLAPVINIDHHVSNTGFGKINLVDVMAPSTTTLILPLIEELGGQLMDADIATLLLAGLITDTGSFQNPNTTPDAFAIAAKLIGHGARQQEIIRNIYKTKKLSTLRLWGRTLTKIQYDEAHKLVWSILTAKDFAEIGSSPDETEGVIDELMSNAPGAEIIFLLKEKGPASVSGSMRTLSGAIDASKLAAMFGGGGHTQAAGFKMQGKTIQEAEQMVVSALRDYQKKRLRMPETAAQPIMQAPTPSTVAPTPQPTVALQQAQPMPQQPQSATQTLPTPPPVMSKPEALPVQPTTMPSANPSITLVTPEKATVNIPFPPQPGMMA